MRKLRKKIRKYAFPGNIRELQHCLERAAIMAESDVITARDLDFFFFYRGSENN
ncbi:hypothetical protein [Pseudarcicella hirudinis]|uniref:hypothetical protein n=1 Tax=Pseudarcicella hirudinis TaxID=1079859 RepID=UPI00406BBD8B